MAKCHTQGKQSDASAPRTTLRNYYVVPDHWDLTPEHRQPLDQYVLDTFVGAAIRESMKLNDFRTFAKQYPLDAACFFSGPPYCQVATADFGYENPYKLVLAGEEDLYSNDGNSNTNNTNNPKGSKLDNYMGHKMDDYFGNVSD